VSEIRRIHVIVTGRVQGVGYRFFVQQVAATHHLSGFIKNQGDGSVLLEAQGPETAIHKFLEILKTGPRLARVESIAVNWIEPVHDSQDFQIRY